MSTSKLASTNIFLHNLASGPTPQKLFQSFCIVLMFYIYFVKSNTIKLYVNYENNRVLLNWTSNSSNQLDYTVYSQNEDSIWKPISLFDNNTKISVLNVYPSSTNINVTFYYGNNIENRTVSSALQVWLEGGSYETKTEIFSFDNLVGKDNDKFITVKPISSNEFEDMEFDEMKNYDVIVIGFMDSNGGYQSLPSNDTVDRLSSYIDEGYGVLLGHDSVGYYFGNSFGYGRIASKFGIVLGTEECFKENHCSNGTLSQRWMYWSKDFHVATRGLLNSYPYKIPDGNYSINLTHTCSNAAFGDVWMELGELDVPEKEYPGNYTEIANFTMKLDGYNEERHGNWKYYLTTYNNTAMTQTGHTLGNITLFERQLLVNTICYLYQKTKLQYAYDNSVVMPMLKLNITERKDINGIEVNAANETKIIKYKVIGKENDNKNETYESDETEFNFTVYPKCYYYIIDSNELTIINETTEYTKEECRENFVIGNIGDKIYVHVAVRDNLERLSETSHYFMELPPQTNTFSKSNPFSNSNTFTESFQFDVVVSHSFSLMYSHFVTESLTMYYSSMTKTFIQSSMHLSQTFIITDSIFYEYSVIKYSTLYTYYSNFFVFITIENSNFIKSDGIDTKVLIGIICGVVAFILIIIGIVVLLIKIHKGKKEIEKNSIFENVTSDDRLYETKEENVSNAVINEVKEEKDNWL